MYVRRKDLQDIPYVSSGGVVTQPAPQLIPREGWAKYLQFHLVVALALSAGTTSGAVVTDPELNPAGVVTKLQLDLIGGRDERGRVNEDYSINVPISLWYCNSIPILRQKARLIPIANGNAGSQTAEMVFIEHVKAIERGLSISLKKRTWKPAPRRCPCTGRGRARMTSLDVILSAL